MKPPRLPTGRTPLAVGGGSDKVKLVLLVALLLVFLFGYVYVRTVLLKKRDEPAPAALYVRRPEPPEAPLRRQPSVEIDRSLLAQVRDDTPLARLVREPKPYAHLLGQARRLTPGDLAALGLRPIDREEILRDPAAHRGEPFWVKGTLISLEVVQGEVWQEIRGTLRDREGRLYAFTVLEDPDVQVGDVVKVAGFFFKVLSLEVEPGRYEDAPVLVGRTVVRSFFPLGPVTDLSEIPFDEVRDFDVTEMVKLPDDVLYRTLAYVRGLSPEKAASLQADEVDYGDLRRDPDRYRGRVVRLLVRYVPGLDWQRKLGPGGENPLEIDTFYDGILALPRDRLIRWIGLHPFPREDLGRTRLFHLTGVFLKVYAWQNEAGRILSGPLLVPIRFDPFFLPKNEAIEGIARWIGASVLVLLAVFFVLVMRDEQASARFRREYLARRRRKLEKVAEALKAGSDRGGRADGGEAN